MKTLKQYLTERLIIKKINYNCCPKTKKELQEIIKQRIDKEGHEVDLNNIDVSKITDMSYLFENFNKFNGDISEWDVSNVTNMKWMFYECTAFNKDISSWDVSNVTNIKDMFYNCAIEEKHKPKFK